MHDKKKQQPSTHSFLKQSGSEPFFKSKNNALPEQLQQNLESSFNQDFSEVDIQRNSQRASELNAAAFAEGESIHFAPGQFDTGSSEGKSLIGHEFAHVVQQRKGIVAPTGIAAKGIAVNDNTALESEAERKGEEAAAGVPHTSPLGASNSVTLAQAKGGVAQLAKQTAHYGEWFDDTYALTASGKRRGVDMTLRFKPTANADAELIALTQSVQALHNGTPFYPNSDPFYEGRAIKSAGASVNPALGKTDEGTRIDNLKDYNTPLYAVNDKASASLADSVTDPGYGQHGFRFTDPVSKTVKEHDAKLIDRPAVGSVDMTKNSSQIFETAALATKGAQAGTYYGSVQWGWQTDNAGTHKKLDFKIVSEGAPSSTFLKAGEMWNASKTEAGADTIDLPSIDVKLISNAAGVTLSGGVFLPKGTRVIEIPTRVSLTHTMIKVVDGTFTGKTGWVPNGDLSNERS